MHGGRQMTEVERYQELVERIEKAKRLQSEAKGSLKQIKERLKESHGCDTLKEAKALLKKVEDDLETAKIEADSIMEETEKALADARFD